jgi:hypothetical protein
MLVTCCYANGDSNPSYEAIFSKVGEFVFDKLHYGYSAAIRYRAGETLGLMSRVKFERIVMMFMGKLMACKTDDDYREYVYYQRAMVR